MRASIFGSATTGPTARGQTTAVRAGEAGRACAEASRAQPAAGIPPQDMARTSVSKRFMALISRPGSPHVQETLQGSRGGARRVSVTGGGALEAPFPANFKGPRWLEGGRLRSRAHPSL